MSFSNNKTHVNSGGSPHIKSRKQSQPNIHISKCIRCGSCCKNGGPSFHHEDKNLIEKGIIPSKFLYTIRQGELSYDNVQESLLPAVTDIIKIKGQKDSWTCVFFDEAENECTIYDNRPIECRVLKCWDTREIEKIYAINRLTRRDLISTVEGLWDLIEDHQKRCAYDQLQRFRDTPEGGKMDEAAIAMLEIIAYDTRIRRLVVEKGGLDPEIVDFVFGRPMTKTIRMYGFQIEYKGDKYRLIPIGPQ